MDVESSTRDSVLRVVSELLLRSVLRKKAKTKTIPGTGAIEVLVQIPQFVPSDIISDIIKPKFIELQALAANVSKRHPGKKGVFLGQATPLLRKHQVTIS